MSHSAYVFFLRGGGGKDCEWLGFIEGATIRHDICLYFGDFFFFTLLKLNYRYVGREKGN